MVTQDFTLRVVLQALSILQLLATYGLLKGSSWSYYVGLAISGLVFAISASLFWTYYTAPLHIGLITPLLFVNLGVGIVFVALTWVYLSRPRVRAYLTRWL